MRDALARAGYALTATGDPHELAHLIVTGRPQLVLLDLVFPGVDGIGLLESVPGLADLSVISISGYGRDETIARALEAGADDYTGRRRLSMTVHGADGHARWPHDCRQASRAWPSTRLTRLTLA